MKKEPIIIVGVVLATLIFGAEQAESAGLVSAQIATLVESVLGAVATFFARSRVSPV